MRQLIHRKRDLFRIQDLDAKETIILGREEEAWEDEEEAVHMETSSNFVLTDDRVITRAEEVGPQCGNHRCHTRLSQPWRACSRCALPLCRRHTKRFRGETYCKKCRWISVLKIIVSWLIAPVGGKGADS